jgi:hypothetical protein
MCSCLLLGLGDFCQGTAANKRLRSIAPVSDMNAVISASVPSMAGEEASAEDVTARVYVKRKLAGSPTEPQPVLAASQSVIALSSIRSLSRSQLASLVADVVDGRRPFALT